jgi:hypothetical protein
LMIVIKIIIVIFVGDIMYFNQFIFLIFYSHRLVFLSVLLFLFSIHSIPLIINLMINFMMIMIVF